MKRARSGMLAVVGCFMAVSLSAQTPPPSETQTPPERAKQGPPSMDPANKVIVTGCLERAKPGEAPTGTTGAAATRDTTKFVLNNVTAAPSGSGTAGTTGATQPIASSYRLDGTDSQLTPHLGHKIEITGFVEKRASETGTTMAASAPKLKVDSVRMISDSCTP